MDERGPKQPSLEEQERCVQETVALCRRLQSEGRLHSGVDVYIGEAGRVTMRPLPPDVEPEEGGGEDFKASIARKMLGLYQEVRNNLSRDIDITSEKWLASPVGKALGELEKTMRDEVNKMEAYAKEPVVANVYNIGTFTAMSFQIEELLGVITRQGFIKKWEWQKMHALNTWGKKFVDFNRKRSALQAMSLSAQVIILVDELRQDGKDVSKLMRSMATPKILSSLRSVFKEK